MAEQLDNFEQSGDSITLSDIWGLFLSNWKWFLVSVVAFVGIALMYALRIEPTYEQSASVMIKEDGKGGSSAMDVASAFSDMGLGTTKSDVNNEVEVFKSPDVILETIKRLNLDVKYYTDGSFHRVTLYGATSPIIASLANVKDDESCTFTVELCNNGSVEISDMVFKKEESSGTYKGKIGQPIKTIAGNVVIMASPSYVKKANAKAVNRIYVSKLTSEASVASSVKRLNVATNSKQNTVIDIAYTDVNIDRAKDFINTLIAVYNEHWVEDKNQIAVSTSKFINDRLRVIEGELGNVDADISSYKSANMVPDVAAAGALYMQEANMSTQNLMNLNNQLYMAKTIRAGIVSGNDVNLFKLLPANSGVENVGVENQISEFNKTLLQRNNFVANSSTENPFVKDLDAKLIAMRQAISQSLDYVVTSLNSQIKSLQGYNARALTGIQNNPTQAKSLLSVERQQKVKESLYLFLLQKREENELNQAFTAYNTRIVSSPHGSSAPIGPQKAKILMVAFILGLALPGGVLYAMTMLNTKVRGRKDVVDAVTMPFVGEVPSIEPKRHIWEKKKVSSVHKVVVEEGSRNIINEAFRILRTNVEFLVDKDRTKNVFAVSSYNPGSGKTFIAINLAVSYLIKGKKVLVIDCDFRHASLSKSLGMGGIGLVHYLTGQVDSLEKIIHTSKHNLQYIPVGVIPPNPTELLQGEKFSQIIEQLRGKYDMIFIDCPPVNIVADTSIIEQSVDRTLFIIRAGLLERSMLPVLENDYRNDKFKNMALVLNGTTTAGGSYGYGYGYGYGYYGSGAKNSKYYSD